MKRFLATFGPLLALVLLWGGFALATALTAGPDGNPWSFANWRNQATILAQSAIVVVAACGMTLVIVSGGIDLAVGSVVALASVCAAKALAAGWGPLPALAVAVSVGALCGAVSGTLIGWLRLAPFIATLGMLGVARGTAKGLADNQTVNFDPSWLDKLMQVAPYRNDPALMQVLLVAPGVWVAGLCVLLAGLLMARTPFGRTAYAIGSSEAAARLCGVAVARSKLLIYLIAGAFTGLAGLLETARLHQGDPSTASGRELDVIAAVVIGGASLSGGVGTVGGAVIGALVMGVLRNGSQQMDWPTWVQEIIIGAVIVVAVAIDRWRQGRREG